MRGHEKKISPRANTKLDIDSAPFYQSHLALSILFLGVPQSAKLTFLCSLEIQA
jgi:hypothetical protein